MMIPEGVQVKEPRSREDEGEHVAQGHGRQDEIRGRPHVLLREDEDDQRVGADRHHDWEIWEILRKVCDVVRWSKTYPGRA